MSSALSTRRARLLGATLVAVLLTAAPAAAQPLQARQADAFVDSVGVNVHLGYTDSPYGQDERIRERLVELGVRYVRDGLSQGRPDVYRRLRELAAAGIRSNLIIGDPLERWGVGPLDEQLDVVERELAGAVASLEGPNEYDIQGDDNWLPRLQDYQRRFYQGVHARPALAGVTVIGPVLVGRENRARLGDMTRWLDHGNMHPYPGGNAPDRDVHLGDEFALASRNSGDRPVQATETGYHTGVASGSGHLPASERAAGIYMPRLYLDYFRRGIARAYAYELIDQRPDGSRTDEEAAFGLLNNDFSEKPAYTSLKRLLNLLSDRGPAFQPGALDVSLAGGPPNLRQLLLQKRDGTWYLALWSASSVWDPQKRDALGASAASVHVAFPNAAMPVAVHRPNDAGAAIERHGAVGALDVRVGPELTVLEIGQGAERGRVAQRGGPCSSRVAGRKLRVLRRGERRRAGVLIKARCPRAASVVRRARARRSAHWLKARARRITRAAHTTGWQRNNRGQRVRTIRLVLAAR